MKHRKETTMKELTAAKAYAALIGSVITAILATVPPDTRVWTILSFVAAVCTAVATFAIPNKPKAAALD